MEEKYSLGFSSSDMLVVIVKKSFNWWHTVSDSFLGDGLVNTTGNLDDLFMS